MGITPVLYWTDEITAHINSAPELYRQFFLFTLDQSAGQICAGAGQVAQSALQVAHFGEKAFSFVT